MDRLLRAAPANGCNPNLDDELLQTAFRRRMLLSTDRERLCDRTLRDFVCVLIRQCIANEYVFATGSDEHAALAALTDDAHPDTLLLEALYRLPSPR
jgi:Arc/MetJ family transcription regulator